ncbi:MAG: hypothetical protein LKF53_05450 [Solobacterium sp.]|nr:hypothetical protein [Solobacterium sp.]MCH4227460.1 hypothetical protein [Solobacterium sp.]MCH4282884.1 hypothetical protein [Solobacterium sp.]
MPDQKSLQEQAEEALNTVKKVGGETYDAFKNSSAGKEVFGEDGKLDQDDAERLKNDAGAAMGKAKTAVLGDDGKFGDDDKQRLKQQAEELGSKAKNALNSFLSSKDQK